jgi:hypothetical protein
VRGIVFIIVLLVVHAYYRVLSRVEQESQLRSDADDDQKQAAVAQGKVAKPVAEVVARTIPAATIPLTAAPKATVDPVIAAVGAGKVLRGWDTPVVKVTASAGWLDTPSGNTISGSGEYCLNPAPIPNECTVLKANAVSACVHLEGCVAMSCAKDATGQDICHPRDSTATTGTCAESSCEVLTFKTLNVQKAVAPEIGHRIGIHLQLLEDIQEGDIALDYKPGVDWFDGALSSFGTEGLDAVQFQSDFDHVKIAGHEVVFMRKSIS